MVTILTLLIAQVLGWPFLTSAFQSTNLVVLLFEAQYWPRHGVSNCGQLSRIVIFHWQAVFDLSPIGHSPTSGNHALTTRLSFVRQISGALLVQSGTVQPIYMRPLFLVVKRATALTIAFDIPSLSVRGRFIGAAVVDRFCGPTFLRLGSRIREDLTPPLASGCSDSCSLQPFRYTCCVSRVFRC